MKNVFLRVTKLVLLLFVAAMFTSCASTYYVHKESPSAVVDVNQYPSFYVGWLDLQDKYWEEFGYESLKSWKAVIDDQNYHGIQPYMKKNFPNKNLIFAGPEDSQFPDKGDLYIKFDVTRIDKNWNAVTGGFDDLYVDVSFIDIKSKEELYSANINTTSMGMGPQGWTFEGRLGFAVYNLCSFVYDKLNE